MTQSKLFILGQEIELLWTDMNYHRDIRRNGKPTTEIIGGLITICYATDYYTDLILRWMTKESEDDTWNEVDKMEKGYVCFYENGFDYPPTKTYQFSDAHLIYFKESFYSEGSEPMKTIITISPAIQNYGTNSPAKENPKTDLVKRWNNSWIPYEERMPYQQVENKEEFYLSIKHLTDKKTFVPLGIPSFIGTPENKNIEFEIEITENDIDEFIIEILQDNDVVYTVKSGEDDLPKNYKVGKHTFKWDGFGSDGIYDSVLFTERKLKARVKGKRNGKEKIAESGEFSFEYKKVNWVDIKIDKNTKRIDVTLRINLKEKKIDSTVNKTFNNLLQLAKEGLIEYWGRNSTRSLNGKTVSISGIRYEVYINPINTKKNSMPKLKVFAFKHKEGRSRNWWLSRKLFYNEDYAYDIFQKVQNTHDIKAISKADGIKIDEKEFKHTAAHEIGHEILQAFGGKNKYSYIHKGTSTLLTQKTKPKSTLPSKSEIDLMKYFFDDYFVDRIGYVDKFGNKISSNHFYKRNVANEIDVLGLIWCTKIELR